MASRRGMERRAVDRRRRSKVSSRHRQSDEARGLFESIIAKAPDYAPVYFHFGQFLRAKNEEDKAREFFQTGLSKAQEQANEELIGQLQAELQQAEAPAVVEQPAAAEEAAAEEAEGGRARRRAGRAPRRRQQQGARARGIRQGPGVPRLSRHADDTPLRGEGRQLRQGQGLQARELRLLILLLLPE